MMRWIGDLLQWRFAFRMSCWLAKIVDALDFRCCCCCCCSSKIFDVNHSMPFKFNSDVSHLWPLLAHHGVSLDWERSRKNAEKKITFSTAYLAVFNDKCLWFEPMKLVNLCSASRRPKNECLTQLNNNKDRNHREKKEKTCVKWKRYAQRKSASEKCTRPTELNGEKHMGNRTHYNLNKHR